MRYIEKELFRTGEHVDMHGNASAWSVADLDAMIAAYNEVSETDLAPVVLGHPTTNAPAYGWLVKIWRNGDTLSGLLRSPDEGGIADLIEKGRYENVSLSVQGHSILHVGFLGAALPAVSSLERPIIYAKNGKNANIYTTNIKLFAGSTMEEKIATIETAIANQELRIAGIESSITELKDAVSAMLESKPDVQAQSEEIQASQSEATKELTEQVAQLSKQNNALAFDGFKAYLESEDVAQRLNPALKNQFIEKAEKVLRSGANFAASESVQAMKEVIAVLPKNAPITSQFSSPAVSDSEKDATNKIVARFKVRHGIQ